MPGEPIYMPTTRSVRLRIDARTNPGKLDALDHTVAEWDRAVALYTNVFVDHPGVFEAHKKHLVQSVPDAGTTKEVVWTMLPYVGGRRIGVAPSRLDPCQHPRLREPWAAHDCGCPMSVRKGIALSVV
jgi:hypothetical protein